MWQLRKLSTNEPLREAGPLPNNWGPIFGLSGIQEKLGDLSWLGPSYADQGWLKLSEEEQETLRKQEVVARVNAEKAIANAALSDTSITLADKIAWEDYLMGLDTVCLCPDFGCNPKFPPRPSA